MIKRLMILLLFLGALASILPMNELLKSAMKDVSVDIEHFQSNRSIAPSNPQTVEKLNSVNQLNENRTELIINPRSVDLKSEKSRLSQFLESSGILETIQIQTSSPRIQMTFALLGVFVMCGTIIAIERWINYLLNQRQVRKPFLTKEPLLSIMPERTCLENEIIAPVRFPKLLNRSSYDIV